MVGDDTTPLPSRDYSNPASAAVDVCSSTRDLEAQFIRDKNLIPYAYKENYNCCVLYSSTTRTYYEWPKSKTLTSQDLELFKYVGHTMGIDYTRTYTRMFALNVDCLCRTFDSVSNMSINDEILCSIRKEISAAVRDLYASRDVQYEVWKSNCGYHIYTDLEVSLPTHLHLAEQVAKQLLSRKVVIEVPNIMPLPYSVKISYLSHQPVVCPILSQQKLNLIMDYERSSYLDVYSYSPMFIFSHSDIKVQTITGTLYLNYNIISDKKYELPNLARIISVQAYKSDMRQMLDYLQYILFHQSPIHPLKIETLGLPIVNSDINKKLKTFMLTFNKEFSHHDCLSCDLFIKNSLLDDGGLYLQPYVVMLNKYLLPISDAMFKEVLNLIYQRELAYDPCIKRFVQYYDENTRKYYSDSGKDMMDHLYYLYVNQLSATMSLGGKIEKLVAIALEERSHKYYKKSVNQLTDKSKMDFTEKVLDIYINILFELQIIVCDSSTYEYYVFDGNYYRMVTSLKESLPNIAIIYKWLGHQPESTEYIYKKLETIKGEFTVKDTSLFCDSKFQFATSVGTFNSLLGMYTAKTRFLRFNYYREVAIWKLHVPCEMYTRQNYDVLERLEATVKYAKFMHDNVGSLFVHFVFAPAMMQLKEIWFIEESIIGKLINLLNRYEDLSSAYFLVEYFSIDPKFIYLIMYIYEPYDKFGMATYQDMAEYVLGDKEPNIEMWQGHFEQELESVTLEEKESHMDTLLTIYGPRVNNVTRKCCFYATIIAACINKCWAYQPFVEAFKVLNIRILKPRQTKLEYDEWKFDTSIDTYRSNMHRAIKILFGDDLSKEDKNIVATMFGIGISTYFDPIVTIELLSSFSSLFVPREEKVVVRNVHIGESSIFSIMEKMAYPEVSSPCDVRNRFHVIEFNGPRQIDVDTPKYCLLQMLADELVYNGMIELTMNDLANAINFLGYLTYLLERDNHLLPTIN